MSDFSGAVLERKKALLVYIPLMLLYASSYFQRTAIPGTLFDKFGMDYGFSALQIAGLGASFIWIYSLSQLIVGMLADKYSGMRVVTVGGVLFAFGVILFPLSGGHLGWMYFFRSITGLGASTMYLSLVKETDRLFGRKNYSVMIGIVYFVGYSGGLFGTLPFERICAHYDWNSALLWIGIVSAALYGVFLVAGRAIPPAPVRDTKISFVPLILIMKNPITWALLFCSTVNFGTYYIIQTVFGKKFLQDFAGMSSETAAGTVCALTFVCMLTLLGTGILTRLIGNRRKPLMLVSTAVTLLNTGLIFIAVLYRLPAWVFALNFLMYAFSSGFSVVFSMACQEVNSRDTLTQAAGFLNMCNYMAVAVFAILIGKLLDAFVNPALFEAGTVVTYPASAYLTIFGLLLIPASASFVLSFFLPETKGHYFHLLMVRS